MAGSYVKARWADLPMEDVRPGVRRSALGTERAMLVMNELAPDMQVVPHSHDFDQIAVVVQGRMRFTVGGETVDVEAGEVLLIPSGVEHAGEVLGDEPALNLDVFAPARADYRHLLSWMDHA